MSDLNGDDFVRNLVAVRAFGNVAEVVWKIPKRLAGREDAMEIVLEEIAEELRERESWPSRPA